MRLFLMLWELAGNLAFLLVLFTFLKCILRGEATNMARWAIILGFIFISWLVCDILGFFAFWFAWNMYKRDFTFNNT